MQPKQFWTKSFKVLLVLFIIGGVIYSLIEAIGLRVWWIAPVGWAVTFASASAVGMYIEISENIAELLEIKRTKESNFTASGNDPFAIVGGKVKDDPYSLLGYASNTPQSGQPAPDNSVSSDSAYFRQSTRKALSEASEKPITYEKKDYWICPACGEFNDLDTMICKRCDKQVWVCPQCGEANDFNSKACSKCGWQA